MAEEKKSKDLISRGQYEPSPIGTAVFVGLRALDGFVIQRALQILNPLPALFARFNLAVPPPPPSGGDLLSIAGQELTPFQAVIWGMSIANALKQIYWLVFTSKESMSVSTAITVGVFNTVFNALTTLAFSLAAVNPTWSEATFYVSIPIFAAGILIETLSEVQRKAFKDDPKNQGKIYSGGLFQYARHINYFGYMLWRGSMALAGGGWAWGALTAGFFWNSFVNSSIPELDAYCTKKYGEQWEAVKRKVPYAFFPGIH